jgi:hypothetical protein
LAIGGTNDLASRTTAARSELTDTKEGISTDCRPCNAREKNNRPEGVLIASQRRYQAAFKGDTNMLRHIIVAFLILCASPVLGQPRSLLVGNEGSDSPSCGGFDNKCRSISQAIRNAADGDTVFVEAGVYGDLNRNGVVGESGEEGPPDRPCLCLVLIDKRITVLSERGAAATIIDASTTGLPGVHVVSGGAGAVFGYTGMGFTVVTPEEGASPGLTPTGIRVQAPATTIAGNRVVGSIQNGVGTGDSFGIVAVTGSGSINHSNIYDNEVSGFGRGIWAEASRIVGNVVTRNRVGVTVGNERDAPGPSLVENNTIADNQYGIDITVGAGVLAITGNDILHNQSGGIRYVARLASVSPQVVMQDNNIIDNGHEESEQSLYPGTRCGLVNDSTIFVWAADNYWGALGRPDNVCNWNGSSTQIDPVRQQPDSRVSN